MKTRCIVTALLFLSVDIIYSQHFATNMSAEKLVLDNGVITRIINLGSEKGGIVSISMKLKESKSDFLAEGTLEFSFIADGKLFTGADKWTVVNTNSFRDEYGGDGASVTLDNPSGTLRITVNYLLYPKLPLIKKNIIIENRGKMRSGLNLRILKI